MKYCGARKRRCNISQPQLQHEKGWQIDLGLTLPHAGMLHSLMQ